jgi:hypothetical protein
MSTEKKKKTVLCLSTDVTRYMLQWCSEKDMIQIVRTCKQWRHWKGNARITKQIDAEREATIELLLERAGAGSPRLFDWQSRSLGEMARVIHERMPMTKRRVHMNGPARNAGKTTALLILIRAHISAGIGDFPEFVFVSINERQRQLAHEQFNAMLLDEDATTVPWSNCVDVLFKGGKISVWFLTHVSLTTHCWAKNEVVLIDDIWVMRRDVLVYLPRMLRQCRAVIGTSRSQPLEQFTPPWRTFDQATWAN